MDLSTSANEGHVTDDNNGLKGMYKEYFLDYASYVILERAVPAALDGLKPVQRRILHSMKKMDDGRYTKVANIIGNTMSFHPHGDAAIGDALVNMGQKDLLIDCQGNWGDSRTGDRAAASRYIEARLTKFALAVAFNNQTTQWQVSYDGRQNEPINLPMKFPLLLAQGGEGIAVGLSTKILPHNFIELVKSSIKILEDKPFKIYPDFPLGGTMDASDYNKGARGGKIKLRAKIEVEGKNTLKITEIPFSTTTTSLIDSIIKANEKGKIKIKKVIDNTAAEIEILIELANGISPEVTIDALFAFTNCEVSISPNACVILDDKPLFTNVHELLKISTFHTKDLLRQELEIKKGELEEKWQFSSLEKIFIQNRIYREIEEAETWEAVIQIIDKELKQYLIQPGEKAQAGDKRLQLIRPLTEEDIVKLTEIKIKRISKFNTFKADEIIRGLEEELEQVKYDLNNLTAFAINYFEDILEKYGKDKKRRTEIASFEKVEATLVVANNTKLYVNRQEGFIGKSLKKDEFVKDCSDIDDIIVFRKDGKFLVTRISDKSFVGKNILHVDVWRKGDERTTYNLVYVDGGTGKTFAKRFNVKAITRDKEYDLTKGTKGSKLLYFTANANGESEKIQVQLSQGSRARNKMFEYDFSELQIKGRGSQGNTITKYPVRKISLLEKGQSSLGAINVYMDEVSGRLNTDSRGLFVGGFDTGDQVLCVYKDGTYELKDYIENLKFNPNELFCIRKLSQDLIVSAVYFDGNKGWTMVKRFQIETSKTNEKQSFISENEKSKLLFCSLEPSVEVSYQFTLSGKKMEGNVILENFIEVKGWKALGNKLSDRKLSKVKAIIKESPSPKEGNDNQQNLFN
jgi:topoisomerase-4 subunit A